MIDPITQISVASQIVDAVRSVVGPGPVALHEPRFDGNEWLYLKECLDCERHCGPACGVAAGGSFTRR